MTLLDYGDKRLSDLDKGVMSDIEVIPVIIAEILYPHEVPLSIRTYIESAV